MENKYVDFVSDAHFKKGVKNVWGSFSAKIREDDELQRNGIDPIKMLFNMKYHNLDFKGWKERESERQNSKTSGDRVGEFHQFLLGGVKGWTNLEQGHESGLDLMKDDKTIFMELKNKDNDLNGNVEFALREKMFKQHKKTPDATIYLAYICAKNKKSEEKHWRPTTTEKLKLHNDKIRRISGSKVYELITGEENALRQVWECLPIVIKDVYGIDSELNAKDQKEFEKWFETAF